MIGCCQSSSPGTNFLSPPEDFVSCFMSFSQQRNSAPASHLQEAKRLRRCFNCCKQRKIMSPSHQHQPSSASLWKRVSVCRPIRCGSTARLKFPQDKCLVFRTRGSELPAPQKLQEDFYSPLNWVDTQCASHKETSGTTACRKTFSRHTGRLLAHRFSILFLHSRTFNSNFILKIHFTHFGATVWKCSLIIQETFKSL